MSSSIYWNACYTILKSLTGQHCAQRQGQVLWYIYVKESKLSSFAALSIHPKFSLIRVACTCLIGENISITQQPNILLPVLGSIAVKYIYIYRHIYAHISYGSGGVNTTFRELATISNPQSSSHGQASLMNMALVRPRKVLHICTRYFTRIGTSGFRPKGGSSSK
jgi:hypothetical protein